MFRRAQAEHVLRDFFRRYPPDRVAFSEPSSSDDGQTATGRYWPESGGAPLNVRVLHRVVNGDWELVVDPRRPAAGRARQRPLERSLGWREACGGGVSGASPPSRPVLPHALRPGAEG